MQQRFRLRRKEDFARLRREGRSYPHRFMTLSVVPNGLPNNRYGFIISKHLGNAVKRNRVRRLLREGVRHLHPRLLPGYDVVIIARRDCVGQPFLTIQRTLEVLLVKAKLAQVESDLS
jgi:ribonuclease P protein component